METKYSFIFRIMGGTADGENNQDWTAERTTGKIPCNLCGYLYLWWSSGRRQDFRVALEPIQAHEQTKITMRLSSRANYTQVTSPGGLWDSSGKIYSLVKGAYPLKTPKLHWTFKSGATVNFAHLGSDSDCQNWQGSQIAMIGFDELTHFSKHQFFYMLSRNRTDSGVAPYVRATCNPDADSWVADFIKWWITPETGYPIPERSGVIRYMVRLNDEIIWGDSKEELAAQGYDAQDVKSVTFIASTLQDNQILMKMDPGYLANLKALPTVERERLLLGNWKIKAAAGSVLRELRLEKCWRNCRKMLFPGAEVGTLQQPAKMKMEIRHTQQVF